MLFKVVPNERALDPKRLFHSREDVPVIVSGCVVLILRPLAGRGGNGDRGPFRSGSDDGALREKRWVESSVGERSRLEGPLSLQRGVAERSQHEADGSLVWSPGAQSKGKEDRERKELWLGWECLQSQSCVELLLFLIVKPLCSPEGQEGDSPAS